jgi:hypothetical protein
MLKLRIAIGSAILSACLGISLIGRAQHSSFEVPGDVVLTLAVGPRFTIALIVVASVALLLALRLRPIHHLALIGTAIVLLTSVLLTITIIFFDPAQWPVRLPNASAFVGVMTGPTIVVSGVVFWLLGFYFALPSSHRGTLQAALIITASTIGAFFGMAALYGLIFYLHFRGVM